MLREDFKDELRESLDVLAGEQRRLEGLRDLAEHDGLPAPVVSILARKAIVVGHLREDLKAIPKKVVDAEGRS